MSATYPSTRLTRLAILAVAGAAAVSVAACGTSNKGQPGTSASSSPTSTSASAKAEGKDRVAGLIASVSGNAIQVSEPSGTATVDFTPSTKVTEVTPAQLTDVTTGSCVTVRPRRESASGGATTAQSVRILPAVDGKCPEPKHPATSATTTTPSTAAPEENAAIRGTVASVAGNTITVNSADASGNTAPTAVTVTDKTKYTKQATTGAQAITQGKCINARGTKDGSGALQATTINLQPADNGKCPEPGGQHHGR